MPVCFDSKRARLPARIGRAVVALLLFAGTARAPALAQSEPDPTPDAEAAAAPDAPDAQARERARDLFERASREYESGNYAGSIALLREAHAAYPSTRFIFNIAQAQRQLGDCSGARQSYLEFLEAEADPELRARATVGLERLGDCRPRAEPVAPGPLAAPPPAERGAAATPRERPRSLRIWLGWTSTGVLAAATVVTGGLTLSALSQLGDVEASKPADPAAVDDAEKRARSLAIAADVLGAATLVAAGVSLYWTIKEKRARKGRAAESAEDRARLSVHLSSTRLGCRIRF